MDREVAEEIQGQETIPSQDIDFNISTQKQNKNSSSNDSNRNSNNSNDNKGSNSNSNSSNDKNNTTNNTNYSHNQLNIIIDNIENRQTKTNKAIEQQLTLDLFTNKNIRFDIKHLKKGGLVLTIKTAQLQKDIASKYRNIALNPATYSTEFFGKRLWIKPLSQHMPKLKWLCIPRISVEHTIDDIEQQIMDIDTNMPTTETIIAGLHRQYKGPYPTKLIKFTVDNDITYNALLHKTIQTSSTTTKIQPFIDSSITRCTHCQTIGHLARTCPRKDLARTCVRCAGNCPMGNCLNTQRRCANCKQPHAASYKLCPLIRQHTNNTFQLNKQKTWAEITASNTTNLNNIHLTHQRNIEDQETKISTFNDILTSKHDTLNKNLNNITQENMTLKTENKTLTKQLNEIQTELNKLRTELEDSRTKQNILNTSLHNYIDKDSLTNILAGVLLTHHKIHDKDKLKFIYNIITTTLNSETTEYNTTHPPQQSTPQTNQYGTTRTAHQTPTNTPKNTETNSTETNQIINNHNV